MEVGVTPPTPTPTAPPTAALGNTSPPTGAPSAATPAPDNACEAVVGAPAATAWGAATGGGGTALTATPGDKCLATPGWPRDGSGLKLDVHARSSPVAARTHPYRHNKDTRATKREVPTGSGHARSVVRRSSSEEEEEAAVRAPEPSDGAPTPPPSDPGCSTPGAVPMARPVLAADVVGAGRAAIAPGNPRRRRLANSGCWCRAWAWTRPGPAELSKGPPWAPDDGSTKEPLVTAAPYPWGATNRVLTRRRPWFTLLLKVDRAFWLCSVSALVVLFHRVSNADRSSPLCSPPA